MTLRFLLLAVACFVAPAVVVAEGAESPAAPLLIPLPPDGAEGVMAPPPAPEEPVQPPEEPPAPEATRAASDPWALYNQAFSASVAAHEDEAIPLLRRVVTEHPTHPAAVHSKELLRIIEARLTGQTRTSGVSANLGAVTLRPPVPMPVPRTLDEFAQRMRAETPSNSGQVTLVLTQTINGIALGAEVCLMLGCPHPALGTLSVLGGAGLGLGLSLAMASRGVTAGHALSLGLGGLWGFWNAGATVGLLLSGSVLPDSGAGGRFSLPFGFAMGQLVGTLVGEIAYQVMRPGDGDVLLTASTAAWAITVTNLVTLAVNPRAGLVLVPATIISGDLGLIVGGLLSMVMPMGAGRIWVISGGGLLGSLGGLVISALAAAGTPPSAIGSVVSGCTAGGILVGLGIAAFLTRNMDVPSPTAPQFTLMATTTGEVTPGVAFKL